MKDIYLKNMNCFLQSKIKYFTIKRKMNEDFSLNELKKERERRGVGQEKG